MTPSSWRSSTSTITTRLGKLSSATITMHHNTRDTEQTGWTRSYVSLLASWFARPPHRSATMHASCILLTQSFSSGTSICILVTEPVVSVARSSWRDPDYVPVEWVLGRSPHLLYKRSNITGLFAFRHTAYIHRNMSLGRTVTLYVTS